MISIVVPFRGEGLRAEVLAFVRSHMEPHLPDAEWLISGDDGSDPFWKTWAINRGVERARYDVLMILDSDTYVVPKDVLEGARLIREGAPYVQPWKVKYKLKEEPSREVLDAGSDWDGTLDLRIANLEHRNSYWAAPPLMLSRDAFEAIGGADERLRGWGSEDDVMVYALRCLVGRGVRTRSNAMHLWHPRRGRSGSDLWEGQEAEERDFNRAMADLYKAASRNPRAMRILTAGTRAREEVLELA